MLEVLEHHGILRLQTLKFVLMLYKCDVHVTEVKKHKKNRVSKHIHYVTYQVKQVRF